jgi:hypothetical protein
MTDQLTENDVHVSSEKGDSKMKSHIALSSILAFLLLVPIAMPLMAQDAGTPDKADVEKTFPSKPPYSPYAGRNFPTRPFFGDTHLHTSISVDAGAFGTVWGQWKRIASLGAKRSPVRAASG